LLDNGTRRSECAVPVGGVTRRIRAANTRGGSTPAALACAVSRVDARGADTRIPTLAAMRRTQGQNEVFG
jgi:hypothetical protein